MDYSTLQYKNLIDNISGCSVIKTNEKEYVICPSLIESFSPWGFIEWNVFELGNGDYCGFYWKIGGEQDNPIICAFHHEEEALLPWASSLENFFKIIVACDSEVESIAPFKSDFWFDKGELQDILNDYKYNESFQDISKITSLEDALKIDRMSPICLKYMGDYYRRIGEINLATKYYLKAITSLPEYGDASFALGIHYRAQKQHEMAIPYLINAFTSPFYFCREHEKILNILHLYKDDSLYDDNTDPIWKRRRTIKLDYGEKYPTFHHALNDAIEEYIHLGQFRSAIGLRLFLGLFCRSNDRLTHCYQYNDHIKLLRKNLEDAGLEKRIPLLGL